MTALATTLLCPPSMSPEAAAAGSGDSGLSNNGNIDIDTSLVDHDHDEPGIKPGKEEDDDDDDCENVDKNINTDIEEKAHNSHSSSAHTDDEEVDDERKDTATTSTHNKKVRIQCDNNNSNNEDDDIHDRVEVVDNIDNVAVAPPKVFNSILKVTSAPPAYNRSPRWSDRGGGGRRGKESYTNTSDSEDNNNTQESYANYKIRRKNLIKIERLTDSDSRGREEMRSRALSPPSSSDEENLHIGWVAYPIVPSVQNRRRKSKSRNRQKPVCTCVNAIKTIFYPVAKICHLCRSNRVGTSQTTIHGREVEGVGNGLVLV